jgi:hypothetical protein
MGNTVTTLSVVIEGPPESLQALADEWQAELKQATGDEPDDAWPAIERDVFAQASSGRIAVPASPTFALSTLFDALAER